VLTGSVNTGARTKQMAVSVYQAGEMKRETTISLIQSVCTRPPFNSSWLQSHPIPTKLVTAGFTVLQTFLFLFRQAKKHDIFILI
jgi:hypothetical protein